MTAWWNSLSVLQQVLFVIACATTLFMIAQIVMMLLGGDHDAGGADAGFDVDIDGTAGGLSDGHGIGDAHDIGDGHDVGDGHGMLNIFGLRILTVRTVIAFFSIGSWIAFTVDFVLPTYAAILIGLAAGIAAAFFMAYMMSSLMKLQNSGNIDPANAVGRVAEVYLTVPPARTGKGKLTLELQERFVEIDAVTSGAEAIPTGAAVRITGLYDEETVEVEPAGDATRIAGNR